MGTQIICPQTTGAGLIVGQKALAGILERTRGLPDNDLTHTEYRMMCTRKIRKGWDGQWPNWDNTFSPEWGDVSG